MLRHIQNILEVAFGDGVQMLWCFFSMTLLVFFDQIIHCTTDIMTSAAFLVMLRYLGDRRPSMFIDCINNNNIITIIYCNKVKKGIISVSPA